VRLRRHQTLPGLVPRPRRARRRELQPHQRPERHLAL